LLERMIANGLTRPEQRVVPGSGESLRSSFVQPYDCDTVLIQGVTLRNAIFWQVHPTLCRNVTVDTVTTDAARTYLNTDGCDPESSDHVVIKNCDLGSNDDNIAIKSGRDEDGRRVNVPSQNIVVFGCVMNGTWGAITCGSEQTGGIRNVYAYRITIVGDTKYGLYVKSNTRRGGFTENVRVDRMTGVVERSVVFVTSTFDRQTGTFPPSFAGLTVTNSSCTAADRVLDVNGLPESHVRGLTIRDCDFAGVRNAANIVGNVDDLAIANVRINGARIADTNIVEVVNRATGKVLAVSGDPTVNGAAVVQATSTGSPAQQWQLVSVPGGFVTLVNRASGRVLDVTGASTADDAPVIQYRETEAANQQWRLTDASAGHRTLTSRRSGKLLDVTGTSTADGAPVVQRAATGATRQQWRLVTVG
jgi:polygalacturonase